MTTKEFCHKLYSEWRNSESLNYLWMIFNTDKSENKVSKKSLLAFAKRSSHHQDCGFSQSVSQDGLECHPLILELLRLCIIEF